MIYMIFLPFQPVPLQAGMKGKKSYPSSREGMKTKLPSILCFSNWRLRLLFLLVCVFTLFMGGFLIAFYITLWILIPEEIER